jgi:hypothetical protein
MLESKAVIWRHLNPVLEALVDRKVKPNIKGDSAMHMRGLLENSGNFCF